MVLDSFHNPSFNEAGAFPPRKWPNHKETYSMPRHASMRPGRFHPGNSTF